MLSCGGVCPNWRGIVINMRACTALLLYVLTMTSIPFNRPYVTGEELAFIAESVSTGRLSGDGPFTRRCSDWLVEKTGSPDVLLTHSGTAALEMAALLCDIEAGDEVIMPSFTFVSTANAFVLRRAVVVFVDIRPDTLNIDESLIEDAITPRTKAIVVVHYAGIACDMDAIMEIANRHGLPVIEDAAHGLMATHKGRALGSIGHLGCLSFHETKPVMSGEGGALMVNDSRFSRRAELIREKGTNRSEFLRGQVERYTWVEVGSSYLPSEIVAAFLFAQLQEAERITSRRLEAWTRYHQAFDELESAGRVRRPGCESDCVHNAHLYYLLLPTPEQRTSFIQALRSDGIEVRSHFVPLHCSPMGQKHGRVSGPITQTTTLSERLVRLPLWMGVEEFQDVIIKSVKRAAA